jgi:hypothetical protein
MPSGYAVSAARSRSRAGSTRDKKTAASQEVQQNSPGEPPSTGTKIASPAHCVQVADTPRSIRRSDWFSMPLTVPDGTDRFGQTRPARGPGRARPRVEPRHGRFSSTASTIPSRAMEIAAPVEVGASSSGALPSTSTSNPRAALT